MASTDDIIRRVKRDNPPPKWRPIKRWRQRRKALRLLNAAYRNLAR